MHEATTNADGDFKLALPADNYDIEIAPDRSPVDRTIGTIQVSPTYGLEIIKTYLDTIEPHELFIDFAPQSANSDRIAVVNKYHLTVIAGEIGDPSVLVSVPVNEHPQLIGEDILRNHVEVEAFTFAYGECPQ